jgi:type II secretory pathway component PulJ
MKRRTNLCRDERGFWLLESVLAVAIFALGMIALGQCVNNCLVAERIKQDDLRARQALQNRMVEIDAGSVQLENSKTEDLKGAYEGMKLKQTRVELKRKNEKEQDIRGIYAVTLELMWQSDGQDLSRELTFYVYPRQR